MTTTFFPSRLTSWFHLAVWKSEPLNVDVLGISQARGSTKTPVAPKRIWHSWYEISSVSTLRSFMSHREASSRHQHSLTSVRNVIFSRSPYLSAISSWYALISLYEGINLVHPGFCANAVEGAGNIARTACVDTISRAPNGLSRHTRIRADVPGSAAIAVSLEIPNVVHLIPSFQRGA